MRKITEKLSEKAMKRLKILVIINIVYFAYAIIISFLDGPFDLKNLGACVSSTTILFAFIIILISLKKSAISNLMLNLILSFLLIGDIFLWYVSSVVSIMSTLTLILDISGTIMLMSSLAFMNIKKMHKYSFHVLLVEEIIRAISSLIIVFITTSYLDDGGFKIFAYLSGPIMVLLQFAVTRLPILLAFKIPRQENLEQSDNTDPNNL